MWKIIHDILTEKDGDSYCPVRTFGMVGFFVYLILCFVELTHHCKDFDLLQAASGMSMILGVIAGGITVKQRGES